MIEKVKTLRDLRNRIASGEKEYIELPKAAEMNLGCEHLGDTPFESLERYLMAMIGEYGQDETEVEDGLVEEINFVRDCI